jgi:hypothetical protein
MHSEVFFYISPLQVYLVTFCIFLSFSIFSRFVVIPYTKLQTKEGSLKKSLALQAAMKEVMAQVIRSVGVILQLRDDFTGRQEDELFNEVVHFTEELTIDLQPRDQTNYALLLYSTIKVRLYI